MKIENGTDANVPLALIMKGGGIKGLAYVGALEELQRRYNFNWYIGTSAGAIAAVLLGAGYSVKELEEILKNKNFKDFFDANWWRKWVNLAVHHGMHPANAFTEWLDSLLAKRIKSHSRVRLSQLPFRVTVFASQRNKSALMFDSKDNDADAAYAVRCSMSIPFVFIPQSDQGIRAYDGGMQHNYPIEELQRRYPGTPFTSLYLGAEVYEPVRQNLVIKDLLSIWTEASDQEGLSKYIEQTVVIDPRPIGTLDFGLTDLEKQFLLTCGRTGALAHLAPESETHLAARRVRDELKLRVETARQLKKRQHRKVRAFFVIALCTLIAGLTWLIWFRPVDLTKRRLIFESHMDAGHLNASAFDTSMPGIVMHWREVVIDLSNEVPVPPYERDTKKLSPSVHTYAVHGERTSDEAKYLIYEFASQRRLMDINCVSDHPHAIWYRQDPLPVGKGFNNVWTFVVDLTQHSRDIPFTVKFRVTRWNAYQADNKNFVGHLVAAKEGEIRSKVFLPRTYVLASDPRLLEKKQGNPEAKWEAFTGNASVTNMMDKTGFDWVLRQPKSGWVYVAEIDWKARKMDE